MSTLRRAHPADIDDVRRLLEKCNLPGERIEEQFVDAFTVAEHDGEIVGVAGIERYGEHGLLRSVAVSEPYRGRSVGRMLIEECLAGARRRGISEIYLLTTDAEGYFEDLGFTVLEREQVPHTITKSHEYVSLCPDTATVMMLSSPRLSTGSNANP